MIGRKAAISRAQLDALSPFNPLSEIRVALWRAQAIQAPKGVVDGQTGQYSCTTPCWKSSNDLQQKGSDPHTKGVTIWALFTVPWDWLWAFPAQLREGGQSPLVDVIYSLSLSIYGKNCTHAMIFKSFLLKWNSDFRTISYKRMEIHHFAMKTT
ncbi:hypothetical protein ACJX0J_004401 [Zea mays]